MWARTTRKATCMGVVSYLYVVWELYGFNIQIFCINLTNSEDVIKYKKKCYVSGN